MKIHFHAAKSKEAQKALRDMTQRYGHVKKISEAEVIVSLGGDGTTLAALQKGIKHKKPVYGLNFGTAGFLQNAFHKARSLLRRIKSSEALELSPLMIEAEDIRGRVYRAFAVNEAHVCNHDRNEIVYMKVAVGGKQRVPRLGADGLIVSTTVGSTGYNKSARGPILPLGDDLLAFTPNNAFVPDRMRASVIRMCPLDIQVINPKFRVADLYVDNKKVCGSVKKVRIRPGSRHSYTLLFDRGHGLQEKVMRSQFLTPEV